ncbi:MAG TPA: hypothetical protein VMV77_08820 [Bacteroidales bacterium]|nr:hypothetical protein [Bacteroidales bacterium]
MTEEKKYLVNVESNLDQYAKAAAKAKEEVDKLKLANMQMSKDTPREEVEKNNAALKAAEKTYRDAQKEVQVFTAAIKSETGSRKQLGEVLSLQQKALGKLGNAYVTDAKGVMRLNSLYVEQTKKIKATKDAIIQYDKAQSDGRSSVGLYSEAIEGSAAKFAAIPGPIGQAATAISRYTKVLLANPIVLLITAIVGAIALLVKAFKSTDSGATALAARFEQLKAILDVFRQRLIAVTSAIQNIFKGEWKKAGEDMKEAFTGIGDQLKEATKAAYDYVYALDRIEDSENNYVSQAAENRLKIAKLEYTAQDRTKSTEERRKALVEAMAIGLEEVEMQKKFANDKLNTEADYLAGKNGLRREDILGFLRMTDAQQANASRELQLVRDNNEEKFKELEGYYAKIFDAETRFFEEQKRNISKLSGFDVTAAKELADQELQALKDRTTEQIMTLKELVNEKKYEEIKAAEDIGEGVLQVQKKYAKAEIQLAELTAEGKQMIMADAAGSIAAIFGEQTAIGKAAAVAQATISTYAAATKALATYPPPFSYIAMAATILTGLANVKKIMEVKSGLPGDSGRGMSTSISSSPAAQRTFASQVAPSFVTQPQLTQTQLNAAPQDNMLTAADIAAAFAKMPAPIVTVEDINARIAAKNKVEVRANI